MVVVVAAAKVRTVPRDTTVADCSKKLRRDDDDDDDDNVSVVFSVVVAIFIAISVDGGGSNTTKACTTVGVCNNRNSATREEKPVAHAPKCDSPHRAILKRVGYSSIL